jgi:hypothetical protein
VYGWIIVGVDHIAVDIISFGEVFENEEKLTAFQNAVNNNDNRYLSPFPRKYATYRNLIILFVPPI